VLYNNGSALIVRAALRFPRRKEFACVIFEVAYDTGNGITVHVYVHGAHENAYLKTQVLEVFLLGRFLYYHNFSICGDTMRSAPLVCLRVGCLKN
jgi:hypothetical protein